MYADQGINRYALQFSILLLSNQYMSSNNYSTFELESQYSGESLFFIYGRRVEGHAEDDDRANLWWVEARDHRNNLIRANCLLIKSYKYGQIAFRPLSALPIPRD